MSNGVQGEPGSGEASWVELADVIDVPAVQSLMEHFHKLAGIPMSIVDLKGNVLVVVGWQDVCTKFHRVHPETRAHCLDSDTTLSAGIPEGEFRLYRCRNHMWDVATPIFVGGKHLGNLFSGQFFFDDERIDEDLFCSQAARYGFDAQSYWAALERVPRVRRDTLETGMGLFTRLAHILSSLGYSNWRLKGLCSERTAREAQIGRLSRLYAVRSLVSEAIVRIRDERSLYRAVCRVLADEADFPLVWIGAVEGRQIRPVAWHGSAAAYLEEIRVEIDGALGMGPTGTCVREKRPVINDDFDTNSSTIPWRSAALRFGFRASASFPLSHREGVVGTLTLYSLRPGAFDSQHVALLEALCSDVSYALAAMEQERLRCAAEQALQASEATLREADRKKNEFLAVLSHELRNPLTPINNSLFILQSTPPGGPQAIRAQAVIARQVDHLTHLVDDLLDITRIARNKVQLHREYLDLNEIVARAVDDHRSLFEDAGVLLEFLPNGEPLWVEADAIRIAQVSSNLLQNALKFTRRGGRTAISVCSDETHALAIVRVVDDGAGIAPEMLPHLFTPFMQAEATLDRNRGGLGLGLALVKGLVELHGGAISATSDGLGQGASFEVRLPTRSGSNVRAHFDSVPPSSGRARRVMIVEDNVDAADTLREVLEFRDHSVEVAHDGLEALEKARSFRPDVVLCDIGLPGMDGYELARSFRADEFLRETCLVALSGYALPEDRRRAREAGFDHHLPKPPALDKLDELLQSAR